jgi:hypothetical protein
MCGEVSEFAVWGKARHLGVRRTSRKKEKPAEFDHPVCLCMHVIIPYWMLNLG